MPRVEIIFLVTLPHAETEGREERSERGESDVDIDAPFVLLFVGHGR